MNRSYIFRVLQIHRLKTTHWLETAFFSEICLVLTLNFGVIKPQLSLVMLKSGFKIKRIFTESTPRPIQSKSLDVHLCVGVIVFTQDPEALGLVPQDKDLCPWLWVLLVSLLLFAYIKRFSGLLYWVFFSKKITVSIV